MQVKVKVKLSLYWINDHAMKTCRWNRGISPCILKLGTGDRLTDSRLNRFPLKEKPARNLSKINLAKANVKSCLCTSAEDICHTCEFQLCKDTTRTQNYFVVVNKYKTYFLAVKRKHFYVNNVMALSSFLYADCPKIFLFSKTANFISLISVHNHWTVKWAGWIQIKSAQLVLLTPILIYVFHLFLGLYSYLPHLYLVCVLHGPHIVLEYLGIECILYNSVYSLFCVSFCDCRVQEEATADKGRIQSTHKTEIRI
jgi:hypothetical protein